MSKYIDAERLRKEVKGLERAAHKSALGCADSEIRKFHEGKDFAYQHVGILIDSLQQEQDLIIINKKDWEAQEQFRKNKVFGKPLQQEQQEVDLEKFTEKMDAWKARYNYPDNIIVRGAMAFTARMFYMYPEVAREWYDSLPKVTLD